MKPDVDLTNFRELTGGNPAIEKRLFADFIAMSQTNLAAMHISLKSGDTLLWKENAHMMKGACKNLGAFALADLMAKAETSSSHERPGIHKQISEVFEKVREFLENGA